MDQSFNEMFDDLENQIFQVVFYPDRIYHAAYLNATRATVTATTCSEVRNAFDITVLKAEVFLDGVFLSNVLRIEYRGGRLTEVAREQSALPPRSGRHEHQAVRSRAGDRREPCRGPQETVQLHYDQWINAYQVEIWESVAPPPRAYDDFRCSIRSAARGRSPACSRSRTSFTASELKRIELAFLENDVDLPFGYQIGNPASDNNYLRSHQVPNTPEPERRPQHGDGRNAT